MAFHTYGTDILTAQGWKNITDVRPGDSAASYSPDRRIEYHPVQDVCCYNHDDELVRVNQQRGIGFNVTQDHYMVIDTQRGDKSWRFRQAKELKIETIPRTGHWSGFEYKTYDLAMPSGQGCGRNTNAASTLPMNDWLEFLGWWMAEGASFRMNGGTGSPVISIRQTRQDYIHELTALFTRLPWRYRLTSDGQYIILSKQLYDELHPLGNAHTKRIPRWIFTLSPRQLRIFWDAFAKGDGYFGHSGETVIGLCNPGLIDDLQEMAFLLGLVGTIKYQKVRDSFDVYTLYTSQSRSGNMIKQQDYTRTLYRGDVWRLNVAPYHTILARFNGRYFWVGDSEVSEGKPLAKMPTAAHGKSFTEEHKHNISKALEGRTFSEATRARQSDAAKRRKSKP